jgi:hypothetical protein
MNGRVSAGTVVRALAVLLVLASAVWGCGGPPPELVFAVTADIRGYTGDDPFWFRGACGALREHSIAFMVSPGDIDPPQRVRYTIDAWLDPGLPWFPVVGNHEAETPEDMAWLRAANPGGDALPGVVRTGPPGCEETTYSFDWGNVHLVVLNLYFDGVSDTGADGDVGDALYAWLEDDLEANRKPVVLVFGHEPAYPQPDALTGRARHLEDSLNAHPENRDRFWLTLRDHGVRAYLCGHTHNYSAVRADGVWQVDVGHARGLGDTGSPSTYVLLLVYESDRVVMEAHRLDPMGCGYRLSDRRELTPPAS